MHKLAKQEKRRIFRLFFADGEKDKGKIGGFYREKAKNGDFIYPGAVRFLFPQ